MRETQKMFKEFAEKEILAKKYGKEVVINFDDENIDDCFAIFNAETEFAENEYGRSAANHLANKHRHVRKRKTEFKFRDKKKKNAQFTRSGLIEAESGSVHSRVGSTYNKKMYHRITKSELDKLVAEEMEPICSYRDYSDDFHEYYDEYLEEHWDDYFYDDDYYEDYDSYMFEKEWSKKVDDAYQKGYSNGYAAGYAAALEEVKASYMKIAAHMPVA